MKDIIPFCRLATAMIVLTQALSACAMSDESLSRIAVQPGKYDIYTCAQIADQMTTTEKEGRRLEGLMERAGQDAGGRFMSSIGYKPDYLTNRGEMRELRASAASKHCPPAETPPADRAERR